MQSVYFSAPADWAVVIIGPIRIIFKNRDCWNFKIREKNRDYPGPITGKIRQNTEKICYHSNFSEGGDTWGVIANSLDCEIVSMFELQSRYYV